MIYLLGANGKDDNGSHHRNLVWRGIDALLLEEPEVLAVIAEELGEETVARIKALELDAFDLVPEDADDIALRSPQPPESDDLLPWKSRAPGVF